MAKITLIGMIKYMEQQNDDLFSNLELPDGMDKDLLIDTIIMHGAEFGMIYGDPYFNQELIKTWSRKHAHTFERWIKVLSMEYDPLRNYDRTEEWSDVGSRSGSHSDSRTGNDSRVNSQDHSASDSGSHRESYSHIESGSQTEDLSRTENQSSMQSTSEHAENSNDSNSTMAGTKGHNEVNEHQVSAYDASTYQPDEKTIIDSNDLDSSKSNTNVQGSSDTEGSSIGSNKTDEKNAKTSSDERMSTDSHVIDDGRNSSDSMNAATSGSMREDASGSNEETSSNIRHGRAYGNIGVMTTQSMLNEEFQVAKLNIYEEASDMFLSEFCIYLY